MLSLGSDTGPRPLVSEEDELQCIRQRLMELAGIGMYRYAMNGRVLAMDKMTLHVLELGAEYPDPSMVVGKDISELFQYVDQPQQLRSQVLREGQRRGVEYPFVTRSGKLKWCIHDAFLVKDDVSGVDAVQVISRDITELKTAQIRLQKANQELSEANAQLRTLDAMKTSLLANVSHELSSPLVSIRGYAEMIGSGDSGPINDTQRRQLEVVLTNVDRLAVLIDDLIHAARNPEDTASLAMGSGELHGLLEASIASVEPRRRLRRIHIETAFFPEPISVQADLRLLSQVVVNLLDNAIKFTPQGGQVRVSTHLQGCDHVVLEVSDNGIGIPAEALLHIFERFYQVDSSSTRSYSGLGLGLAICRDVVERHGGSISAVSTLGEGSTFRVVIPRVQQSAS